MRPEDLEAVVEIDAQVFGQRRSEYYERKVARSLDETQQLVTSLVIEVEGKVARFDGEQGMCYLPLGHLRKTRDHPHPS